MQVDQGAVISAPGNFTARTIDAYAFGTGDFSVAALFQTTQGGAVASKRVMDIPSSESGGGWLVVIKPDGTIKFATDDGISFYEVDSKPTTAIDGNWHHVAAVRQGGALKLYFDGLPLPAAPQSGPPAALNVSGIAPLMIGGADQRVEQFSQFVGTLEDVVLFNRALAPSELPACMFDLLTGSEPGLVGLFQMNGNGNDDSPQRNNASQHGNVRFAPVCHCVWAIGDHAFSYLCITSLDGAPSPGQPDAGQRPPGSRGPVTRTQSLYVAPDAPYLAACITDDSGLFGFPSGASLSITDPTGLRHFNQNADSAWTFVKTAGNGSPRAIILRNPAGGKWTVSVTAPADVNFCFSMVALPSGDVMGAIQRAMAPVLPPLGLSGMPKRALADASYWAYLGGTALVAVGGAIAVAAGSVTAPVAAVGLFAYIAAMSVAMASQKLPVIQKMATTPPIAADQAAQCMAAGYGGGPPPLSAVVQATRAKVGVPSTTDRTRFASRADMGVDSSYHVHLDIGGEGYHEIGGVYSGFRDAINVNGQTTDSQPPHGPIPMLVQVPPWSQSPPYPFVDGIADYVTMQGVPLYPQYVSEVARVVRPGGKLGLWIDRAAFQAQINQLAALLQCAPTYSTDPGSGCTDEFNGKFGYPKVCLVNNRGG